MTPATLATELDRRTQVGSLWQREDGKIRCLACGHRCLLVEGRRGICKVRFNEAGQLKVPWGYVAGLQADPVEKKPFYHVYPGSTALTFGMLGCDLHCPYCQNWISSQTLRDPAAWAPIQGISAEKIVGVARHSDARMVVSSYNEPLITAEWASAIFREATAQDLKCAIVSNGNATLEALDLLGPLLVACKIDLKAFEDQSYRKLGGVLKNVTDTITRLHARGVWLEVVTLLVPEFNNSEAEIRAMAKFLACVDRNIPWHITAFHPDYNMQDRGSTTAAMLTRAAEIGSEEGLHFVYAGNVPGAVGGWENTRCPKCHQAVIERRGFRILVNSITPEGKCPNCQEPIPGVWH